MGAINPYCTYRRPQNDLPWFFNFCVTARCNLYCLSCRSAEVRVKAPEPEAVLAFFDRLAAWLPKPLLVCLVGGEPMMHPRIYDFVARLAGHGFVTSLNTNGSLLNVERVRRLVDAGLDIMNVSLDGFRETHDRLRNAPGLFQGIMDMLEYMAAATSFKLNVTTIIHAQNAHELPDLVRFLTRIPRFGVVHFQAVIPTLATVWSNRFFAEDPLWPRDEAQLARVLATLDELEQMKRNKEPVDNVLSQFAWWRRYFRDPLNFMDGRPCRVGLDNLELMTDGSLTLCDEYGSLGAIEDDPRELWQSKAAQEMRERMRRCTKACNFRVNCCYLEEDNPQ
jgi:MoaA/NifB/PqqE/SkfB family radical SAM enzyme